MISKKLAAALSVAALAAAGSAALAGGADAAASQGANGVTYGTGGTPQAAYDATANSWTLESPTSTGASAQVDLVRPAEPTSAPSFTATAYSAGDPRWVIEFHNGCYLFGTPTAPNSSTFTWAENPGGAQSTDWATALAWAQSCGTDDQVTAAFIVDDTGSGGVPTTLTNVTYNGEAVVPASSTTTVSTVGEIVNANSDKCLDVAGGAFTNGTKLQQWTCGAKSPDGVVGGDQQFQVVSKDVNGTETGYLEAVSETGTVFYVQENGQGKPLTLTSSRSAATDMLKNGSFYTFPEATGSTASAPQVMDVTGRSTLNGAPVQSYAQQTSNNKNQQWSLR
ncbi:MAG TPA: ricin-type beta-trefoil lectin domain protein [Trebonia sp.]